MAVNSILSPYPVFCDAAGSPLEAGFIYIGKPGFEARSTPKASFFDIGLTIPTGTSTGAAIRTSGGYPAQNGRAASVFVDGDFSITVTDRNGVLIFSALNRQFQFGSEGAIPGLFGDGNLAGAGIGFSAEPTTGLIRSATSQMRGIVSGVPVWQATPSGFSLFSPLPIASGGTNATTAADARTALGLPVDLIAQGTLSGSELIIAIPSAFDGIELSHWGYTPSTSGTALRMAIGSGTIGSPTWGANHYEQVQTVQNTTYVPGAVGPSGFVNLSFEQLGAGQTPGSGRVVANGFNVSGFVYGDSVRRGVNASGRATSHGSFGEETAVVHTLIRIFVSAGTMSGSYRLLGYRKP